MWTLDHAAVSNMTLVLEFAHRSFYPVRQFEARSVGWPWGKDWQIFGFPELVRAHRAMHWILGASSNECRLLAYALREATGLKDGTLPPLEIVGARPS